MSESHPTTGDVVAAVLEQLGVTAAFGVISIHNMPILDAIGRRNRIRFVAARGEAGAVNMADAHARVRNSLGVAVTSTGTGAGNAAGALVEALSAETPLLHLTGQIDSPHLGRGRGFIHEAKAQPEMLAAISKAAFQVRTPGECATVLRSAARTALTPPRGPVSVELPADVQAARAELPRANEPLTIPAMPPAEPDLDALAERAALARRPLLWLGSGARHAGTAVRRLAEIGIGIVTSVRGQGVVPEDHPMTLGAFNQSSDAEAFYATVDLMIVVGSRLRSNETRRLPARPAGGARARRRGSARTRAARLCGPTASCWAMRSSSSTVSPIASRARSLPIRRSATTCARARAEAEAQLRGAIAPYDGLVDALTAAMSRDTLWVRDITVANSTWGNRLVKVHGPWSSLLPAGGGIGQGLAMAVGAAVAEPTRKVICLTGDGGLALNMGELLTAAEVEADLALIVMNDRGYGVIRNIQDARFGGRRYFVDLTTPDFAGLAAACGIQYRRIETPSEYAAAIGDAVAVRGPVLVEVDMAAIGPMRLPFAGPGG